MTESAGRAGSVSDGLSLDDPRVVRAVHEFQAQMEAGAKPSCAEFVARYPEIAGPLAECLAGLEFVQAAAPQLSQPLDGIAPTDGHSEITGTLGDFRIIREVGRGGMGVVYEAEQISLGRRVALKVLPFAATMDARHLQRFHNEARAAAGLHHTNIVPVYAVGCERSVYFYAMQFIEGQTLAALISQLRQRGGQVPPPVVQTTAPHVPGAPATETAKRAAASTEPPALDAAYFRQVTEWGIQAAEALDHAHQLGIVHRDVTPANLLVDASGRLWVTDFGLARVQSDVRVTMTGDLVGTLRYMSPEQALAKRAMIDHRTDVYSLGATLYELLLLVPAFAGSDRQELLRQIAFEEPSAPRRLNKAIPAELETIVIKAIEKYPADRYATAKELADDLGRFLRDEPIRARRPTLFQRWRKLVRRHRAVVATAAVATFLLLILGVVGLLMDDARVKAESGAKERAQNERLRAEENKVAALEREKETLEDKRKVLEGWRQTAYYLQTGAALNEYRANKVSRAEGILDQCQSDLRHWEWHYLKRLCRSERSRVPVAGLDSSSNAAFSPDGGRVAVFGTSSNTPTLHIADATTGKEVFALAPEALNLGGAINLFVREAAFSPDGKRVATGQFGGAVRLWDAETGKELLTLQGVQKGPGSDVWGVAFSPDGQLVAACDQRGNLVFWDATNGKEQCRVVAHTIPGASPSETWTTRVAFSRDSKQVATACEEDGTVKVWDIKTGNLVQSLGQADGFSRVAFSPTATWVAATGRTLEPKPGPDPTVHLWDRKTGQLRHVLRSPGKRLVCLAFSPDETRLAAGSDDGSLILWDVKTGREIATYLGHGGCLLALTFGPDGRQVMTLAGNNLLEVWDATRSTEVLMLPGATRGAFHAAISPDGKRVAAAGMDGVQYLWDADTGELLHRLTEENEVASMVAFSPDGASLAAAIQNGGPGTGMVRVWDVKTGRLLRAVPDPKQGPGAMPVAVVFSPDGKLLASAGFDRAVHLWELATGKEVRVLPGHELSVTGLSFSRDGKQLVSASGGLINLLIDRRGPNPLNLTNDDPKAIPDLKVWDPATGKEVLRLSLPSKGKGVALRPDGALVAAPFFDKATGQCTVRLYETATGKEVLGLPIREAVSWVDFSPDGKRLVTGGREDESVKLWDANTGEEIMTLGRADMVWTVAFSPDGHKVVAAGVQGVRVWDATPLPEKK
jgi:WD40 repeat protein/serine/threonine protein kinase